MKELSVYIHIPFCRVKCAYCDFLSFAQRDAFFGQYCNTLLEEIKMAAERLRAYTFSTVFIGGGTPSVLPAVYIDQIMRTVFECYTVRSGAEITIEANPESTTYEKLAAYHAAGINRISFGAQSFDNKILAAIGRVHSAEQLIARYEDARRAGFNNINLDLMFGLPGQRMRQFESTMKSAAALSPEHISCYGLILEEGTLLYNQKHLDIADEDEEADMYSFAKRYLENKGYTQYEISNYAKPGFASQHNLGYWSDRAYIGFGLGAHSYIKGKRFHNTEDFGAYLHRDFQPRDVQVLTLEERTAEYLFLGLRKTEGISEADFFNVFGVSVYDIYKDALEKHRAGGLLEINDGVIRLSEKGVYLSNSVFVDFL